MSRRIDIFKYLEAHPSSRSKDIRTHLGIKPDSYEHMSLLATLKYLYDTDFLKREGTSQHYRYSLNKDVLNDEVPDKRLKRMPNDLKTGKRIDLIFEYLEAHPSSESKEIRIYLGIKPDSYEHMSLLNTLRHLYKNNFLKRDGTNQHYHYSLNEDFLNDDIAGKRFKRISDDLKAGNITPAGLERLGLDPKKYLKNAKS